MTDTGRRRRGRLHRIPRHGAESVGELLQVLDVSVEQSSKRLIAEFDSKFA
jgi:hypothetical protein